MIVFSTISCLIEKKSARSLISLKCKKNNHTWKRQMEHLAQYSMQLGLQGQLICYRNQWLNTKCMHIILYMVFKSLMYSWKYTYGPVLSLGTTHGHSAYELVPSYKCNLWSNFRHYGKIWQQRGLAKNLLQEQREDVIPYVPKLLGGGQLSSTQTRPMEISEHN